jgi:hypothetical protein
MIICLFYLERPNMDGCTVSTNICARERAQIRCGGGGRFRVAQKVFDENDTAN